MNRSDPVAQLKFRDPERARGLREALDHLVEQAAHAPVSVMHVCGSHEQAIAKFGLRAAFPRDLQVIMGPGCPVCVTDVPEVDEAVALAKQGVRIASYGDMLRVPGTSQSLADAKAEGANVDVVYSVTQAVELARELDEDIVFFASGFETTAVATAAVLVDDPPDNFSVLSAHKYIPPVMEIVAEMPETKIEGFLAAGHAATITGSGVFEKFVERHGLPVVIGGFEPLDVLAGLVKLMEVINSGEPRWKTPFRAASRGKATSTRRSFFGRCSEPPEAAGEASLMSPTGTFACAMSSRGSTLENVSPSTHRRFGVTHRRSWSSNASAVTSWPGSHLRPTVRSSERSARPTRRSVPAW